MKGVRLILLQPDDNQFLFTYMILKLKNKLIRMVYKQRHIPHTAWNINATVANKDV